MKTCVLLTALAATLHAQAPAPTGNITPDTVVAKTDGKPVTAGEIRKILESAPPQLFQEFQRDYLTAIADVFLIRHLGAEGEKLKLAGESPWKEQLEFMHSQILMTAMLTHELNSYPVSSEDVDAYYARNHSRYEQARIKVIAIGFKPVVPGVATSTKDVQDAARAAFEAAHSQSQRSEAEAKTLATDLVKKIRAGADFSQLVTEYSDDKDSKAAGGDFGVIKQNSAYPEDLKKAVLASKPGEVSDPVRQSNVFYIIRVEEKSTQPLSEVRQAIMSDIRQSHVNEWVAGLRKRFMPTIEKPEFFLQLAAPKSNPPAPGK